MARANIVSNLGGGLYGVQRIRDTARATVLKTSLNTQITELTGQIDQLQTEYNTLDAAYQVLLAALSSLIALLSDPPSDEQIKAADEKTIEAIKKKAERELVYYRLLEKKLSRMKKQKTVEQIDSMLTNNPTVQAWSVDYQASLSGEVTTAEINDEYNKNNKILKIHTGGPTDKAHQPSIDNGPYGTLYNLIALPAVQKWRPRYRVGTLTAVWQYVQRVI
jgi:hypothetical protein